MINISAKKTYGDKVALDIENLTIKSGKAIALIGANGSGKSTLLKILDRQIAFEGDITGLSKIAYMPQNSYAFAMSVKRNILLPIPLRDRKAFDFRLDFLVEKLSLKNLLGKNATLLSGGETQKMALARTLMAPCDTLLLDEPTSALDVEQAKCVIALLKRDAAERDLTLIFATHSLKQAELLADEAIFLVDGKIVERGCPKTIFSQPQTLELADFISFNL